jgi:hypothetical protein
MIKGLQEYCILVASAVSQQFKEELKGGGAIGMD